MRDVDEFIKKLYWYGILLNLIFFGFLIWSLNLMWHSSPYRGIFIVGVESDPVDLDPHIAYDSISINMIDQCAEGLVRYEHNISDPENPSNEIVPNLAASWTYHAPSLTYTFSLVRNATFHDGRVFNATWVKASFDRLNYWLNATGDLTDLDEITQIAELYQWPNGTRIIDSTTIVSEFVVNVTLSYPYAPFIPLLCFTGSYIFIPIAPDGTELWTEYMDMTKDTFLGTGPWEFPEYEPNLEYTFRCYPKFWKGHPPINLLVFAVMSDANARNTAILTGDIHFLDNPLPSQYSTLQANSNIKLISCGQGIIPEYLGMNNKLINTTWRQVISYVVDYDQIINDICEYNAVRMKSPIPLGIFYANWTFQVATTNITKARLLLQTMGYGVGFNISNDQEWLDATLYSPFRVLNFTYNKYLRQKFHMDIYNMLVTQSRFVGINISARQWDPLNPLTPFPSINDIHLYWGSWGLDYNDPSNIINPLFTNISTYFCNQYNGYVAAQEAAVMGYKSHKGDGSLRDPLYLWDNVQLLMEAALAESIPSIREAMYDRIQQLLVEEDMPLAYGYVTINYIAHINQLNNYLYNNMRKLCLYTCEFIQ